MEMIQQTKKDAIMNLYVSGIDVEFISMQVDLDIPTVITVLKELGIYRENKKESWKYWIVFRKVRNGFPDLVFLTV